MSMATGTDRYAPLREAASERPEQKSEPTPEHSDSRAAQDRTTTAHETRENDAAIGGEAPARPANLPYQSPGWTDRGGMAQQQSSAMEWIKASNERRQSAQQEADRDAPAPEQDQAEKRTLTFNRGTYGQLKIDHASKADEDRDKDKEEDGRRKLHLSDNREHDKSRGR
jgi:hypothetical protein